MKMKYFDLKKVLLVYRPIKSEVFQVFV